MGNYSQKALLHAQQITQASAGRGSATQAEAKTAAYVQQELQKLGLRDVRTQTFTGLRSIWLFLSTVYGLALVGHAAFWLLRQPLGKAVGLGIESAAFLFSGYLLWRKSLYKPYPLQNSLPHGDSQNVLAVIPASQEARQRVVLVANLDSSRAVWWHAADVLTLISEALMKLAVFGLPGAILLYLLSFISGWLGFAWLALVPALAHFLIWFTGVTADLGPYSPGANDNASSVGLLLALAEKLRQTPLEDTEVWLAFTGCGESGCEGLQTFLKAYGQELKEALFLELQRVGIGERLFAWQRRIDTAQWVMEGKKQAGIELPQAGRPEAFSQGRLLERQGLTFAVVQMMRDNSDIPPEWGRLTDNAARLQESALEKALGFTWSILQSYKPANKSLSRTPLEAAGTERMNKS